MAHEVETAMIANSAAWWDHAAQYVHEGLMTIEEAYTESGLDTEHHLHANYALVPGVGFVECPDSQSVIRAKDNKHIATVGPDYWILQNWELFQFLADMADDTDLRIESALSLKEGRMIAVCARFPDHMEIAGEEYVRYLTGLNWHDGTHKARFYAGTIRSVCANTAAMSLAAAKNVYAFRHIWSAENRIEEARKTLGMTFKYTEELKKVGEELAMQKMSLNEFNQFLGKLVPDPEGEPEEVKEKMPAVIRTRDGVREVYRDTDDLENIRGTRWGAMQAVIAYNDHHRNFRTSDNRLRAILTQDNNNQRALNLLTA
jgi:phage/plasmid-like protein (TIGR03299 family)